MSDLQHQVYERLVSKLNEAGIPSEYYVIPAFPGYRSITGRPNADVHCVEAYLGPAFEKPNFDAYALVQAFHPDHPSLALIMLIERCKTDHKPSQDLTVYSMAIDFKFSTIFIPVMYSALNDLDPSGQQRGQLVQAYHSKITFGDLIQASKLSIDLVLSFKRKGQLANIAVDFDDPLIKLIANGLRPIMGGVGDIHWLARTKTISTFEIPIKNPSDGYFLIGHNSTALDEGLKVACAYLTKHYQRSANHQTAGIVGAENK